MLCMFIDQLGPMSLFFSTAFHVVDISYYFMFPSVTVGPIFIFFGFLIFLDKSLKILSYCKNI